MRPFTAWGCLLLLAGACGSSASDERGGANQAGPSVGGAEFAGGRSGSVGAPSPAGGASGGDAGARASAGSSGDVSMPPGASAGAGGASPASTGGSAGSIEAGSGGASSDAGASGAGNGGDGGNGGEQGEVAYPGPELPPGDLGEDLTACAGGALLGHPLPDFDYPEYEAFTLCLVEEFQEPLAVAGGDAIWTYSDGSLYEGQVRHVSDALSFSGGKLHISVREETAPVSWSWAAHSFIPEKPLKSGELRTKFNNFRYGRYEARMKAPDVTGNFIATLFTYRTPGFQQWREIDIELLGSSASTFLSNLIVADDRDLWSTSIEEPATTYPFGHAPSGLPVGFNNRTSFHTYAFEWTPSQIRWFVDDALVRVKVTGVGEDGLSVPELPAKIIMNTWVFPNSDFGGDPSLNVYPFATEYEWFRFYKWDGEVTYPCAEAPSCLTEEDLDYSKNNEHDGITPYP